MNLAQLLALTAIPTPLGATLLLVFKATVILLAALAIAAGLRRASAGTRHQVWLVSIGAVLTLPVLAGWTPLALRVLPAAAPVQTVSMPFEASTGAPIDDAMTGTRDLDASTHGHEAITPPVVAVGSPARRTLLLGTMLIAIWGVVAALLLGRLIHGTLAVRRIVSRATPLGDDDWQARLYDVADRLGIARAPRVLTSDQIHVPFAAGIVRATIILPAECDSWTPGQRDAVLIHELGHVRRRDLLGHTLGRVACALYWFHPLVWTAARRLRDASERACDDLAIRLGSRPSEYAEHLLRIVTAGGRPAMPSVALAMAQRKEFEGRMLAILDPALRRDAPARWQAASLTAALVVLALLVAAAAPAPKRVAGAAGAPITSPIPADSVSASSPTGEPDRGHYESDSGQLVEPYQAPDSEPVRAARSEEPESPRATIDDIASGGTQSSDPVSSRTDRPDVLARILRTDSSSQVRRVAAWGLRQHVDVPVANAALRGAATGDASAEVRTMAVWALEASRDPAVVTALGAALRRDDAADVREMAAWALGQIGDPEGAAFLAAQLDSEESDAVLATIAWALGRITPERAPARLADLLASTSHQTRLMAAWTLSQIADPATLPAVRTAIRQPQESTTMRALLRAWVAMDSSPEGLMDLIDASDPVVRAIAVRALAGYDRIDPWPWPWPRVFVSP